MTVSEWAKKQQEKVSQLLEAVNQELVTAHILKTERIFSGGLGDDGRTRFAYRGGPLYVNPLKSPRGFTPAGKPGSRVKKKDRKTKYFPSYAAYRAATGRSPAPVDLTLFATLRNDFLSGLVRTSEVTWEERLNNPANWGKMAGAKSKYGRFVRFTESEISGLKERILLRRKQIGV